MVTLPRVDSGLRLTGEARGFPTLPDPPFGGASDRPLLLITAVGSVPDEIGRLLAELDLVDDVLIRQVDYPGELMALMSRARWGIYLSLYEGFGIPPVEGMS